MKTRKGQHRPHQQQQEQQTDPISSHLGQMFRRNCLALRKSRRTFPSFDATDGTPDDTVEQSLSQEVVATANSGPCKKKKKRKKKKRVDGASTASASQGENENASTVAASSSFSVTEDLDTKSTMDHSVEALDESVKNHDNKTKQETIARPSLESLPSDDEDDDELMARKVSSRCGGDSRRRGEISPSRFFDQIKPQDSNTVANTRLNESNLLSCSQGGGRLGNGSTTTASSSQKLPSRHNHTSFHPANDRSYVHSRRQGHHSSALFSPTHEQVPEDSTSTQEDDYAKGDAMKDPLQLPYLIASSNDHALFGTKRQSYGGEAATYLSLNRSIHDSAARSNDNATLLNISDLDRVRSLFSEWLDQKFWDDTTSTIQQDWDSFLEFCNDRTHGQEKATGISMQELLDIASSIECEVCRTETLAEVNRLFGEPAETGSSCANEENSTSDKTLARKSPVVVLNPSVLENKSASSAGLEVGVEAAFDYVALEEGHHLPNCSIDSPPIVDDDDCDDATVLQLVESNISFVTAVSDSTRQKQPQGLKTNANNASSSKLFLYLQPLTIKHLENFVQDWLTLGVEEDVVVSMSIYQRDKDYDEEDHTDASQNVGGRVGANSAPVLMSTGELHFLKKRIMEQLNDFTKSRNDMDHVKQRLIQHWDEISPTLSTAMNLEYAGYSVLKSCDDYCDRYVMECILPILSGQLSVPSHSFPDLQISLWTLYLGALAQTSHASDVYYGRLEDELADQQGVLPKIFVSAPMRALYRDLVQEKVIVMSDLAARITKELNDRVMKEWYTRVVWQDSKAEGGSDKSKALDMDFHDLLKELTEWTVAIQGSRMSTINRARYMQIEKVLEILQLIVDPLSSEFASVEPFFTRERKIYFESLLSNIHHAYGVKRRMRLIEKEDIVSMAFGAILMWRHVRIAQSRMIISVSIPPLPLPLYHWMMFSDDLGPYELGGTSSPCWSGWGGRRRVTCMLAGLAYVWLRERCNEWKSEVAERELITDFEVGTSSGASQKQSDDVVLDDAVVANSSRRKKKKKNKGATFDESHLDARSDEQEEGKLQNLADRKMTSGAIALEPSMLDSVSRFRDALGGGFCEEKSIDVAIISATYPLEVADTNADEFESDEKELAPISGSDEADTKGEEVDSDEKEQALIVGIDEAGTRPEEVASDEKEQVVISGIDEADIKAEEVALEEKEQALISGIDAGLESNDNIGIELNWEKAKNEGAEVVGFAIGNHESYVAVQDEDETWSAHDFLIERLVKVLSDPESRNIVVILR